MEPTIETANLTKKFGSLVAVNNLDLSVETSTIHGFLCPNGAGKTTIIKMLIGLFETLGFARITMIKVGHDPQNIFMCHRFN